MLVSWDVLVLMTELYKKIMAGFSMQTGFCPPYENSFE